MDTADKANADLSTASTEVTTRVYVHFRNKPSLQRMNAMRKAGIIVRSRCIPFRLKNVSYSYGDTPGYLIADVPFHKVQVLKEKHYVAKVETRLQYLTRVEEEQTLAKTPSRVVKKARTGTGCFVQLIGGILWCLSALATFVWTLYVLFSLFGPLAIFIGFILAPVTYIASIFIVWFSTGVFPVVLLIPYVVSFVGIVLMAIGGGIRGE